MLVLALDTCDAKGSVAILKEGVALGTTAHPDADYSSWLLPAVDKLLTDTCVKLADVDLFAVATGPGSFTGVRLGLTTVKAWSEVYGKPIAGMSRLEVLATEYQGDTSLVASVLDAQRGQIFAGLYARESAGLRLEGQESVTSAAEFLAYIDELPSRESVAWVGTDAQLLKKEVLWAKRHAYGESILTVPTELAPLIGKLGMRKALAGQVQDALTLDADYVRRSYVETAARPSPVSKS